MLRHLVLVSSSIAILAGLAGCPTAMEGEGEGEHRDAGTEGEGEGEGEGDPGEGEGEGDPGEGEGEPPDPNDEAGDEHDPASTSGAPFTVTSNLQPTGDRDCWSFSANEGDVLVATAIDADCATNATDPEIDLFDAADLSVQYDSDSDSGDGFCARLESVLKAGDWIICMHEWGDNGTISEVTLDVVLTQPVLLGTGETCVPGSIAAVCDPNQELQCLVVTPPSTMACALPVTLNPGDPCTPGVTASVCDGAQGLQCLDPDGDGSASCINPDAEACLSVTEVSGTTFDITVGTIDLTDGSCTYTSRPETVVHYVADSGIPLQNLVFQGVGGVGGLYARTSCELPATQVRCTSSTNGSISLPLVEGGADIFLFVEGTADAAVQVTATATAVAILGDGETCVPYTGGTTLPSSACGPGLLCIDQTTTDVCTATQSQTGTLADGDAFWNRASATCTTTTTNVPFHSYTVTNSGSDSTLIVMTREPGDLGFSASCVPDTFVHVFADGFDPANATTGCRVGDDDGGTAFHCSEVSQPIASGEVLQVVVSAYSTSGRGDYEVLFAAPGSSLIVTPD